MDRVLVHGEQREMDVVGLGDGAPRAMLIDVADGELLEISAIAFAITLLADFAPLYRHRLPSAGIHDLATS